MKFSKEPIAYIGAIIILLQAYNVWLQEGKLPDYVTINSFLVAIGAIIGRKFVSPVAKETKNEDE
jgi:hypothetical protein